MCLSLTTKNEEDKCPILVLTKNASTQIKTQFIVIIKKNGSINFTNKIMQKILCSENARNRRLEIIVKIKQ